MTDEKLTYWIKNKTIDEMKTEVATLEPEVQRSVLTELLMQSIIENRPDVLAYTLDSGVNVDKPDKLGDIPLLVAIESMNLSMVKTLLENGANPHVTDELGENALSKCAAYGYCEIAELLLAKNVDIDEREQMNGFTPLIMSVYNKQYDMAALLLKNQADGSLRTYSGFSSIDFLLELETTNQKEKMLEIFIEHKNQFDADDQKYIAKIRLRRLYEM